jgi:murein DD-endopeptidase MepM/ murein hydrolase activator NlpD
MRFILPIKNFSTVRGEWFGATYLVEGGTPVCPCASGRVEIIESNDDGLKCVGVQHSDGYTSYYWSLGQVFVNIGDKVTTNVLGLTSSPYLYFQLMKDGEFIPLPKNFLEEIK